MTEKLVDLAPIWQAFQTPLEDELRRILGDSALPLYDMMRYHLGWVDEAGQPSQMGRGKALRPMLCLLACQAVGGRWEQALPAAAAVELVHNFSLIHDDIQDASPERRHRPAVWRLWGEAQAINAGDSMHALARLAILSLKDRGVSPEKVLEAAHLIDQACLRLCEGQYMDIAFEHTLDIELDAYLDMVSRKTAALFECSLELGALIGSDDRAVSSDLARFGKNLGMAFQIRDDILGIWGDQESTGKSTGDIRQKKKTLPVIYGFRKASGRDKEELQRVYHEPDPQPEDIRVVEGLLAGLGAREYAMRVAQQYYRAALSDLAATSIPASSQYKLKRVADFLLERNY